MNDENIVQPDAINQDEELDLELNLDSEEDAEALKAQLEKERQARLQLTARAKKAEEELKKSKAKPQTKLKDEDGEDIRAIVKSLELAEKKRQFGYEHGLSPQETDYLFRLNPNPSKELLEDDFIKGGIQAIRAKTKVEANIPSSSASSGRVAPPKPLSEMTAEEKQKWHEADMAARYKRGEHIDNLWLLLTQPQLIAQLIWRG
jgi:hypothetical protein